MKTYRSFKVVYTGPRGLRGSTIKITDTDKRKSITLPYDSALGRSVDQAQRHLESIGISVDADTYESTGKIDAILLSENFTTELRK